MRVILFLAMTVLVNAASAHDNTVIIPIFGDDGPVAADKVYVATSGGDFNNLYSAMASITNASAGRPYQIIVGPGIYTMTSPLQMKSHVHIVGSGKFATTLAGSISGTIDSNSTIFLGKNNASISHLTLINDTSSGNLTIGVMNFNESMDLKDVDIYVYGTRDVRGIFNNGAGSNFEDVSSIANSSASGVSGTRVAYGIYNNASSITMDNVLADGYGDSSGYGMWNRISSSGTVTNSHIQGSLYSLVIDSSSGATNVVDTQLVGPNSTPTGTQCTNTYNELLLGVSC